MDHWSHELLIYGSMDHLSPPLCQAPFLRNHFLSTPPPLFGVPVPFPDFPSSCGLLCPLRWLTQPTSHMTIEACFLFHVDIGIEAGL